MEGSVSRRRLLGAVGSAAAALSLAGCLGSEEGRDGADNREREDTDGFEDGVTVVEYEDEGVVCWVYREPKDTNGGAVGGTGGISCLPANEVNGYGG